MSFEKVYLDHRAVIEQAIVAVCRRHRLSTADAEDFGGAVRLHLIENDYAILRKFQGRSSIKSYLFAVIAHLAQDWRNAKWGKWRPSAEARRLGPVAIQLERLVVRDRLSLDEAHETLRTNFQIQESRAQLTALWTRLPVRAGRLFLSDEALAERPSAAPGPDAPLAQGDAGRAARRTAHALAEALSKLAAQDRLVLKMRFWDDFSVAEIARALWVEQKPLYRRLERLLEGLRVMLGNAGLDSAEVVEALAAGGFDPVAGAVLDEPQKFPGEVRPIRQDAGNTSVQTTRTP